MVDAELLPAPYSLDDPGFDAYLDEITQMSNANPPVIGDLSHLDSMPVGMMATTSGPARTATPTQRMAAHRGVMGVATRGTIRSCDRRTGHRPCNHG